MTTRQDVYNPATKLSLEGCGLSSLLSRSSKGTAEEADNVLGSFLLIGFCVGQPINLRLHYSPD